MIATTDVGVSAFTASPAVRKLTRRDAVLLTAVALAVTYAHRGALAAMVSLWSVSPMYSYGFAVPVISAVLVWTRWPALSRLTLQPSRWAGSVLLAASLLLAVIGRAGGVQVIDQVAFLFTLAASVLIMLGRRYLAVAWVPLAYLLLMIPIWDGFTESLHQPFQLRSAEIGVWLLQAIGIPSYRTGTIIALPNLTLEVARACSGVNYLVAVIALGLPLAYVMLPGVSRRVALLLSAVVVAALSNGLRVALIGLLAYYEVGSPLHGPFHTLHGLFVAGIGYVVLFAGLRVLRPRTLKNDEGTRPARVSVAPSATDVAAVVGRRPTVSILAAYTLCTVLVAAGSGMVPRPSQPVVLDGPLSAIPASLGTWQSIGEGNQASAAASAWPGADAALNRRYRRTDGAVAELYIGYFADQRQDKEMVSYRTADIHSRASRTQLVDSFGRAFQVNRVGVIDRGRETLFWYQLDREPATNRYFVKAHTVWNAIWRGRTNGAVVVLTALGDGSSAAAGLDDLASLVEVVLADCLAASHRAGI